MQGLRRHIAAFALAVIGVQSSLVTLGAVLLHLQNRETKTASSAECSMQHAPGEACPMHESRGQEGHVPDDDGCRLICGASNDVVQAYSGSNGILTAPVTLSSAHHAVTVTPAGDPLVADGWPPPLSPPPRA